MRLEALSHFLFSCHFCWFRFIRVFPSVISALALSHGFVPTPSRFPLARPSLLPLLHYDFFIISCVFIGRFFFFFRSSTLLLLLALCVFCELPFWCVSSRSGANACKQLRATSLQMFLQLCWDNFVTDWSELFGGETKRNPYPHTHVQWKLLNFITHLINTLDEALNQFNQGNTWYREKDKRLSNKLDKALWLTINVIFLPVKQNMICSIFKIFSYHLAIELSCYVQALVLHITLFSHYQ